MAVARRRLRARRRAACRAGSGRALGATDDALRPRLPAGAAAAGTNKAALAAYEDGIVAVLRHAAGALHPGAPLLIVVNDRRDLYPAILERAGLRLEERLRRHVNRRTGRRAGEFFEDVLVARQ